MTEPRNAAALALPTSPPLLSLAILCTKRRAASGCRRCGAFAAPRTAIHAPVRGLRLNTIQATGLGPCLDRRHGPCLDGCRGPSLGGLHGLFRFFMPVLCTKRRTASWCRRRGAFPAPQTAIHATPQHPGPNTLPGPGHGASPRALGWAWWLSGALGPGFGASPSLQGPMRDSLRTCSRDIHETYPQAASNRALTRDFAVSNTPHE